MSRRRYFEEQGSGNGAIYHCVKTEIEPGDRIRLFNLMNKIKSNTISQDKINSVLNQLRANRYDGMRDLINKLIMQMKMLIVLLLQQRVIYITMILFIYLCKL